MHTINPIELTKLPKHQPDWIHHDVNTCAAQYGEQSGKLCAGSPSVSMQHSKQLLTNKPCCQSKPVMAQLMAA